MHSDLFGDSTSGFTTKSENLSAFRLHSNTCKLIYPECDNVIYIQNAMHFVGHMPRFTKGEYLLIKWYTYQHGQSSQFNCRQ